MSNRVVIRALVGALCVLVAVPLLVTVAQQVNAGAGMPPTFSGLVVQEHGDDFTNDTEQHYFTLVTDKDRYSLTGPGLTAVRPGMHVSVRGKQTGGTIYLASASSVQSSTYQLSASEAAMVSATTSLAATAQTKTVAVLLINFASPTPPPTPSPSPCTPPSPSPASTSSSTPAPTVTPLATATATPFACPTPPPTPSPTSPPPTPWTSTQVAGYYFNNTKSVASLYREVSNGSLTVTGSVYGWYTLTISTSTCDYNGFATAARAAATAAGVNLSAYTNIVYAFPRVAACSWGGLGIVNGPYSWINGTTAMGVYVPSHELGHNFGSHHASSLTCTNAAGARVQYSSKCTASEYGDPFDLMGSNASSSGGIHHENTWARRQIGALTVADQQTVTASGTYFVATAEVGGGVPRILRVLRPSGDYYYLEFRQPYGLFDNWSPTSAAVNGVMIRIAPDRTRIQSKLIDAHPQTTTFADAPLGVGEKFVDNVNKITIITRSIGPAGASVYIQVGPDVTAPTALSSLTGTWTAPTAVHLSWRAAFDEIGVTGYEVRRDGTLIATVGSLSFDDASAPPNTQQYAVAARDAAGNTGPSATVFVGRPDILPPSAPGALEVSAAGPGAAALAWSAATDDLAVADYQVSVNGTVVATIKSLTYDATGLASTQTYGFSVAARDYAGNVGPPAKTSMVMPDLVAPGSPADLALAAVGKTSVKLAWAAADDDVGVVGYLISRDGTSLGQTALTSFDDAGLAPDTTYAYSVTAVDAAGNAGVPVVISVRTVEALPPTVSAPGVAVARAGQLDTLAVPVVVSWSAADLSGVARVDLQQSRNGGAWSPVSVASPSATSIRLMRAPGNTYRYRVRATDSVGNTSAWAAGLTVSLSVKQESSSAVAYSGSWSTGTPSSAYGGSLKYASGSTARATLTFTGRSVAWVAPRASTRGVADVYVDGVYAASVDLYSASALPRSIVFRRSWATAGRHTLQIRVKGTIGRPRVDVDAFAVGG